MINGNFIFSCNNNNNRNRITSYALTFYLLHSSNGSEEKKSYKIWFLHTRANIWRFMNYINPQIRDDKIQTIITPIVTWKIIFCMHIYALTFFSLCHVWSKEMVFVLVRCMPRLKPSDKSSTRIHSWNTIGKA